MPRGGEEPSCRRAVPRPRRGTEPHLFDRQLRDTGALPFRVFPRTGSYAGSPDGRYIAFENGSRIDVWDRTTGRSWAATDLTGRSISPVFSPDGGWLGVMRKGTLALSFAHVIPFAPGATHVMDDVTERRGSAGSSYGIGRIGWLA